jgi:hypothetical protein
MIPLSNFKGNNRVASNSAGLWSFDFFQWHFLALIGRFWSSLECHFIVP